MKEKKYQVKKMEDGIHAIVIPDRDVYKIFKPDDKKYYYARLQQKKENNFLEEVIKEMENMFSEFDEWWFDAY